MYPLIPPLIGPGFVYRVLYYSEEKLLTGHCLMWTAIDTSTSVRQLIQTAAKHYRDYCWRYRSEQIRIWYILKHAWKKDFRETISYDIYLPPDQMVEDPIKYLESESQKPALAV